MIFSDFLLESGVRLLRRGVWFLNVFRGFHAELGLLWKCRGVREAQRGDVRGLQDARERRSEELCESAGVV